MQPMGKQRGDCQTGFFLVEVCVAIFVLALVLSAVIPMWMQLERNKANQDVYAQVLNVTHNELQKFYHSKLPMDPIDQVLDQGNRVRISWHRIDRRTMTADRITSEIYVTRALEQWRMTVRWTTTTQVEEKRVYEPVRSWVIEE